MRRLRGAGCCCWMRLMMTGDESRFWKGCGGAGEVGVCSRSKGCPAGLWEACRRTESALKGCVIFVRAVEAGRLLRPALRLRLQLLLGWRFGLGLSRFDFGRLLVAVMMAAVEVAFSLARKGRLATVLVAGWLSRR